MGKGGGGLRFTGAYRASKFIKQLTAAALTFKGCRHTAWPFPANTATLSLKHRARRISILCTGPSTASLATCTQGNRFHAMEMRQGSGDESSVCCLHAQQQAWCSEAQQAFA